MRALSEVRSQILRRTPNYADYSIPLEQRIGPLIDGDDLMHFFSTYAPPSELDSDEFRVAAFGAWDGLLPRGLVSNSDFISQYRSLLIDRVQSFPAIEDDDFNHVIERGRHGISASIARSVDEGWAMCALSGALNIDPRMILTALGNDPSRIIVRWSLTTFLDDALRCDLVDRLFNGDNSGWAAAVVHLEWMLDSEVHRGSGISQRARHAVETVPAKAIAFVLGSLLEHYIVWLRNARSAEPMKDFFQERFSFLEEQINARIGAEDQVYDVISAAERFEIDAAAFIHQSVSESGAARDAASTAGIEQLREVFGPIEAESGRGYISFESLHAYAYIAKTVPMTAQIFNGLFANLQCDELSILLSPPAYWRDRTRAIALCAVGAL